MLNSTNVHMYIILQVALYTMIGIHEPFDVMYIRHCCEIAIICI
jgi:hypothetical protein